MPTYSDIATDLIINNYIVYKHISPSGKVYIGITCQKPERRWGKNGERYLHKSRFGYTHFGKAIKKYGWENIKHEILFSNLTMEDACKIEKELIKKYNSDNILYGYNLTSGGESYRVSHYTREKLSLMRKGRKISQETREKLRLANIGKHASEEAKRKMSLAKIGKPSPKKGIPVSEETRNKISLANKGKHLGIPLSEETKKKISMKAKERGFYEGMKKVIQILKERNSKKVMCVETKRIFNSVTEAGKYINKCNSGVSISCRFPKKTAGGYHWKFV